ncbi:MAG: DUF5615 family PIN-like protein [Desulfococcaceae bacterium]|nr:DUF5615 family PIN-like protein [Desulfococcaceae bacterium]
MKFKIDENLPTDIAQMLIEAGYDAITVEQQNLSGNSDATIAEVCMQENRIIVTLDTDFGDIRTYPPKDYAGIIVLRLKQQDKFYVIKVFSRIMRLFSKHGTENRLWIVGEDGIRIRE